MNRQTEDELDLGRLLGMVLDGKWWIACITGVAMLVGIAYALLSTPIYQAYTLLQVEKKASGFPMVGNMGDFLNDDSNIVTEMEILKSRMVLGGAVAQSQADVIVEPNYMPVVGAFFARRHQGTELAKPPMFEQYAWGGEQIHVARLEVPAWLLGQHLRLVTTEQGYELFNGQDKLLTGAVNAPANALDGELQLLVTDLVARPGTEFTLARISPLGATQALQGQLQISEQGRNSGVLNLSMTGPDPAALVRRLDAIAEQYLLQNVQRMSAEVESSIAFLEQQMPEVKARLDEAENVLNRYRLAHSSVDIGLETQTVLSQMVEIENRLNELAFKEAEMSRLYTRAHPSYQALQRQMQSLQQDRNKLSKEAQNLPETQQEILRLTRDVQVTQEIYIQLLNKMQELNILKASTVGSVRILDKAVARATPVKPQKPMIVAAATLLGAMLGVGLVLVRGLLNKGVENPEDFEQMGMSVYASIPFSEEHAKKFVKNRKLKPFEIKESQLLAAYNPTDLAIESVRGLRTSLHFAMLEAKNNIVAIGGPSPEVGKSFISTNLAAVVAQSGQKVLLVDADMRKGYLHRLFRTEVENGLSDLLSGKIDLSRAVRQSEVEGLHFMPRGQIPPNPSELLMHKSFSTFLDEVSQQYDLVIVDTPPILAVTDPVMVSTLAGTTFMVTRFGINSLKEVEVAQRRYQQNNIDVKGIIFNGVLRKAGAYGYYGNYGYYNYEYKSST